MMIKFLSALVIFLAPGVLFAQYAPAQGVTGSTAINKDSSAIKSWATGCTVTRGPQNISNSSLGLASAGLDNAGIGVAGSSTVSLGDGGTAILTFNGYITNGPGNDFAIFENGFNFSVNNDFLELAFVEVSSDGVNYFRFPASSLTSSSVQVASFGGLDATKINNLAGKYVANYGTPFDLDELKNTPGLNVNAISHVKIIDVVGCIQSSYSSLDSDGNIVNDPWPTPFPASGFDLDAVGVINSVVTSINDKELENAISVYPNPVRIGERIFIQYDGMTTKDIRCSIYDDRGKLIELLPGVNSKLELSTANLITGLYIVKISDGINYAYKKIIIE